MQTQSQLIQDTEYSAPLVPELKDAPSQGPACMRCRQQKLKCSKNKPVCKRCANLARPCSYPAPPDRRRLLEQRRRNLVWDRTQQPPTTNPGASFAGSLKPAPADSSTTFLTSPERTSLQNSRDDLFPSSEVAMFLIEVYFSRAYNATLLYHKQRFVSDWIARKLRSFVALSVFATASIFLQDTHTSIAPASFTESIHDLKKRGAEWATRASQQVLAQADVPNLETVQVCQTLALYWFALGQTKRVHFHVNVAHRVCRLLGIHQESHPIDDPTTTELRRRCLWACWITQCISQENAFFRASCWDEIAGLPLPSDEASYLKDDPRPSQYLTSAGEVEQLLPTNVDPQKNVSFMSELAKLAGIWWEIHDFMKRLSTSAPTESSQCLASWMDIAARLEKIDDALPILYRQDPPLSLDSDIGIEQMFSLLCLRHGCASVLHASIVPLYAPSMTVLKIPKTIVRTAAQQVLDHASVPINLANKLERYRPDRSKISALAGYCLYFCIYVQQKYSSTQPGLCRTLQSHGEAMSILSTLQDYWHPLQSVVAKLQEQREYQATGAQRQENAGSAQAHDLDTGLSNAFPEVKNYINVETSISTSSPKGKSSYNSSPEFRQQATPEQHSNISGRDLSTIATTAQQVGMANNLNPARTADNGFRYATDNDTSHPSDLMGSWWEIGQDSIDPNMFSIFDMDIMNNTF